MLCKSLQALTELFFLFPGKINTSKFWRPPIINFSFIQGENMLFKFYLSELNISIKIIKYKCNWVEKNANTQDLLINYLTALCIYIS